MRMTGVLLGITLVVAVLSLSGNALADQATSSVSLGIPQFVDVDFMTDPGTGLTDIQLKPDGQGNHDGPPVPLRHTGDGQLFIGCNHPARLVCPQHVTLKLTGGPAAGYPDRDLITDAEVSLFPGSGGSRVDSWTVDYAGGTQATNTYIHVVLNRTGALADPDGLYTGTVTVTLTALP